MKRLFSENKKNVWFWLFLAIAAILFFLMPAMARTAGNSGDEDKFQIPQGYNILHYYQTDKQDTTCLSFENLKYYGSSFDYWTALYCDTFQVDNIAAVRHTADAFLGWLCVLFAGLIAYRMGKKEGSWAAGVVAMLLMFLSPRFLGHSFNNPKDIPLAAGVIMSIYYILMFFRQASERKRPKVSTMVMLSLSIALAISTRIGGLIIIGYFGLWGLLWLINSLSASKPQTSQTSKPNNLKTSKASKPQNLLSTIAWALLICVVGFFLGILRWPYAMQAPIANSLDSYKAMSQFAIGIRQIYEGTMMWSDALPWYYTPKFILLTIPLSVLLGWLLSLCLGWKRKGMERVEKAMLLFCFLFPVVWIVITRANVYGGWRHSLFAYPPMVVSAALGFMALIDAFKAKAAWMPWAVGALIALTSYGSVRHIVANHPYEYVYYNSLAGGTQGAFGTYEMDYYYHSMRECTEWVLENAEPKEGKTIVGTWLPEHTRYFLRHDTARFQHRFVRWYERGSYDWDYLVFPLTGVSPEYLTNAKAFPPKGTVHTVEVDGIPIGIVLQRQDRNDYIATQLRSQGLIDSAMLHYRKALAYNPYNETALMAMAEIFLQTGRPDSCLSMCNRFFEFEPSNDNANYMAAYAHLLKGETDQTVAICQAIKKHNFKFSAAYTLLMQLYLQQQNLYGAEGEIMQLIDIDQVDNQTMGTYVNIKKAQGLDERSAVRTLYTAMANSLERRGKKKEAQIYRDYLKQF
ncbi:MAG: phospholipid carrier-dependent glycosyltransferase [Bacteroidales bacterium]|nr:phospholipid carrier-dependent glycosyltransferase [Bacteroidales bacterium]